MKLEELRLNNCGPTENEHCSVKHNREQKSTNIQNSDEVISGATDHFQGAATTEGVLYLVAFGHSEYFGFKHREKVFAFYIH